MAINAKKVVLGGVVAGVVLNIIGIIANGYVLAGRMSDDLEAFKPGLAAQMMRADAVPGHIITNLVLGLALIWTYAAMRPRFGPGMKTAVYAAFLFWILTGLLAMGYMQMGVMSGGLWWTVLCVWLVSLLIAAGVGGWLYTEESATP